MRYTVILAAAAAFAVAGCTSPSATTPTAAPPATMSSPNPATSSPAPVPPPLQESNPVGDIPDNTAFVAYSPSDHKYEVKVPEGWARTDEGGAAVFTDKLNTVRIETAPASAAPTTASFRADELPGITAASTRFKLVSVATAHRRGGDIVLAVYEADSRPDPVTGKVIHDSVERYEFYRAGTEAILTLAGPVGADNVDPWRTVSDSFRWLP